MIRTTLLYIATAFTCALHAQDYAPPAGQEGSTAIPANSELFIAWATGIEVERGYINIADPSAEHQGSNYASYGEPEDALGAPTNSVVSLGDAGKAILTFAEPIGDGPSFDFAIFENSLSDTFLELAFVEVSSDGVNYFRFPSHSQTQTDTQVGGFGDLDATYLNNLAGKYRGLFGTPFDLSDLQDDPLLDKNSITHVKIIDVVGSINPDYARYDSYGNAINDPFSTPFYSGGFDLDAVGIINKQVLGVDKQEIGTISIYPNPASDKLQILTAQSATFTIYDMRGRIVFSETATTKDAIDISTLNTGVYIINIASEGKTSQHRFIKK